MLLIYPNLIVVPNLLSLFNFASKSGWLAAFLTWSVIFIFIISYFTPIPNLKFFILLFWSQSFTCHEKTLKKFLVAIEDFYFETFFVYLRLCYQGKLFSHKSRLFSFHLMCCSFFIVAKTDLESLLKKKKIYIFKLTEAASTSGINKWQFLKIRILIKILSIESEIEK